MGYGYLVPLFRARKIRKVEDGASNRARNGFRHVVGVDRNAGMPLSWVGLLRVAGFREERVCQKAAP